MIYETIRDALIKQLGLDAGLINPNSLIQKDLNLDSTETVILSLEIKKKYNVDFKFPNNDVSLADIVKFVDENKIQ